MTQKVCAHDTRKKIRRADGWSACNSCYQMWYRDSCPEQRENYLRIKSRHQRKSILKKWGFTEESYAEAVSLRGGKCDLCGQVAVASKKRERHVDPRPLHIDHDHTSGRMRGLLCESCNSRLLPPIENGRPDLADIARDYLERHRVAAALHV